ncbi:MAG: xylulokinase [Chloroflexi bacterium]|nr:xylulokinase [Chloroflexota bacterium]
MALLGIDLGTSSVKVLILDTQGHTLSTSKADYKVLAPRPSWAESDPAEWWSATVSAVRAAIAQVPQAEITAIGLSGQMHGVVPTDEAGKPTRAAMLWADNRAEEELERYHALPVSTLQRLANPLVPGMAGPLLCWLARHETASYQTARWAIQPKDWLRWCLTDAIAADPSDASATLLYDLPADRWADDVIAALDLRRDLFPPLLPSGARAAALSPRAAEALGLPPGLPVATGAGDTPAAALGTGLLTPGPIQLTLGTGAQVIQLYSQPIVDQTMRTHLYRAADGVHWYAMAAVQNGGLALDWVCRTLHASWDDLYASAAAVAPGSAGLTFLPYLTRERPHHRNPRSTGAFLGMRINHEREHLLHAALEGVAFGIRAALDALPGSNTTSALRLAGGGSEHPAWRQMVADILQHELVTVDTPAASARGAALLGGIASSLWPDAAATAQIAPRTHTIATPDSSRTSAYDEAYARYLSVCEANFDTTS